MNDKLVGAELEDAELVAELIRRGWNPQLVHGEAFNVYPKTRPQLLLCAPKSFDGPATLAKIRRST